MFPLPIWNNSNNDSLDILELLLNTSKQKSFHELSQNKREINPHITSITATAYCNCKLRTLSAMKEQLTTGVTSLFFLSPFLMKNGYYAELNET